MQSPVLFAPLLAPVARRFVAWFRRLGPGLAAFLPSRVRFLPPCPGIRDDLSRLVRSAAGYAALSSALAAGTACSATRSGPNIVVPAAPAPAAAARGEPIRITGPSGARRFRSGRPYCSCGFTDPGWRACRPDDEKKALEGGR